MKNILIIIAVSMGVLGLSASSLLAQEGKDFSVTADTQWIQSVHAFKAAAIESSSNLLRIFGGVEYRLSEISKISVRFPVVFQDFRSTYTFPGSPPVSYQKYSWYTERLRASLQAKLFRRTVFGKISWFAKGYFPTMLNISSIEQYYYNYYTAQAGLKNILLFDQARAYLLGSASYSYKFEKKYLGETRKYGDELSGSITMGYMVEPYFSPMVGVQYAYVFPMKRTIGDMVRETPRGVSAVHLIPAVSFPLSSDVVIRSNAKILLYRERIQGRDAGHLWGNLEDEGDFSVQLGIRLGLL